MTLDNDLMDLWLRAGELDRDTVRKLIEAVQAGRSTGDVPGISNGVWANLVRLDDFIDDLPAVAQAGARDVLDRLTSDLRTLEVALDDLTPGDNRRDIEDARRMAFVPRIANPATSLMDLLS